MARARAAARYRRSRSAAALPPAAASDYRRRKHLSISTVSTSLLRAVTRDRTSALGKPGVDFTRGKSDDLPKCVLSVNVYLLTVMLHFENYLFVQVH